MARKKKATGDGEQSSPGAGHNQLTDDELHGLHLQHVREYENVLAAKKTADANLKNCAKRIKADGDTVDKVKQTIQARTPEGEAALRAEIESTMEVLRWSGVEVGDTKELFPEDRTPSVDRARAEGKRAGLDGKSAKPPHDPNTEQYKAWMEGHGEGQAVLAKGFKKPTAQEAAGAAAKAGDEHIKAASEKIAAETAARDEAALTH